LQIYEKKVKKEGFIAEYSVFLALLHPFMPNHAELKKFFVILPTK
jgi:hypothetical protein